MSDMIMINSSDNINIHCENIESYKDFILKTCIYWPMESPLMVLPMIFFSEHYTTASIGH